MLVSPGLVIIFKIPPFCITVAADVEGAAEVAIVATGEVVLVTELVGAVVVGIFAVVVAVLLQPVNNRVITITAIDKINTYLFIVVVLLLEFQSILLITV